MIKDNIEKLIEHQLGVKQVPVTDDLITSRWCYMLPSLFVKVSQKETPQSWYISELFLDAQIRYTSYYAWSLKGKVTYVEPIQ